MKRIIGALILILAVSCGRKDFVIDGYFSKNNDTVKLERKVILYSEYSDYTDTTMTEGGHFRFTGVCPQPLPFKIKITGVNGEADIFLENAEFKGTFVQEGFMMADYSIEGGDTQQIWNDMKNEMRSYVKKGMSKINSIPAKSDTSMSLQERTAALMPYTLSLRSSTDSLKNALYDRYSAEHPDSYFALMRLHDRMTYMCPDVVAERFEVFDKDKKFDNYPLAVEVREYLKDNDRVRKGRKASDFKMTDIDDNIRTFSDLYSQNEMTLLVFWTSWAMQNNTFFPMMERVEKSYRDKGLGVVGVSLDEEEGKWKSAVEKMGLEGRWVNLSDHTLWECPLRPLYKVRFFPQVIAIDKEGTIQMSKICITNFNELEAYLEEYFSKL